MIHLRRPIVAALLAFLFGLLATLRTAPPPLLTVPLFVIVATIAACTLGERESPWRTAGLLALLTAAGAVAGGVGAHQAAADCRTALPDRAAVIVRGRLLAAHREGAAGTGAPMLPLAASDANGVPGCAATFRVRLPPGQPALAPGSRLALAGEWRTFAPPGAATPWPAEPAFSGFLLGDSVEVMPPGGMGLLAARSWTDRRLSELFPDHQPLIEALLLGRREYVDRDLQERYAKAGLSHLLAISGMHVGLLAGALILLANVMRLSRRAAVLGTCGAVWLYLLFIGAPASAVRSGVMLSVALMASLLQRPSAAIAGVAAAAFAILAFEPLAILHPGFQLSFLGVLGILVLRGPILERLPQRLTRRGIARQVTDACVVGVAAFVATAPVVAHHFGIVAPISILAGLPAVPLMSLALIGAMAAVTTDPAIPPLARILADGAALALDLLDLVATWAADFPFGHAAVPPPPWWAWGAAAAVALLVSRVGSFGGPTLRRMAAAGAAASILLVWPLASRATSSGLEVHFLDVGQGDAIAIRTPNARWVLVDAGPASESYDAGERRVVPFLRQRGARVLDALVLTHPDLDHIGGAAAVIDAIPVRHVFEPGLAVGRDPYLNLLRTLEGEAADWRAARSGRSMELDGVRFDFLWPDPQTIDASEDANHISAVVRVTFGDFSLLLTGDAGVAVEELLVDRHGDALRADVLKLGHHGSATSSSGAFLEVVAPELAVVSAGRRNRYGHPAPVVLDAIAERAIPLARTDREGTVSLRVGATGRTWSRERW